MADLPHTLTHALRRFTRIPGLGAQTPGDAVTGHVLRAFPLAGIAVALAQGLVYALASLLLPHPVAVLLAMVAGIVLTGGLHEQGWMRWCRPAALSLPLLILLRFETLAHVGTDWLVMALVCAAAWSRACAVLLSSSVARLAAPAAPASAAYIDSSVSPAAPAFPVSAPPSSFAGSPAGLPFDGATESASRRDAAIALIIGVMPTLALVAWTGDALTGVLGLACALVATAVLRGIARRRRARPRAGLLDAAQQVADTAFLIGLLVSLESAELPADTQDDDS